MASVDLLTSVYSAHATYLERVAASFGNDVIPYLESIERRITKTLNAMPNKALTPQETAVIRSEIDKITREELQAYTTQYKIDNKEIGQHQVAFDAKTLESVTSGYEASIPSAGVVNKTVITTPVKIGDNLYTTYNRYIANYWQNYTKSINDTVITGFVNGGTNREIARNILDQITLDNDASDLSRAKRAAKTMARTGTNHYATQSTIAFVDTNDDVLTGYRFLATLDGSTSRQCSANDQLVFKKGESMPTPPLHPNCLFEGALITSAYGVSSVSKRPYKGLKITITTAGGNKLSATPNHPVLTDSGWIPAKLVNKFDKILSQKEVEGVGVVNSNDNDGVSTVKNLFDSFGCSCHVSTSEVPTAAPHFHGDASDGEVAVISSDCRLNSVLDTNIVKNLGKLDLKKGVATTLPLLGESGFFKLLCGSGSASNGIMSRLRKSASFLWRCSVHPSLLLLGAVSDMNTICSKDSIYWTMRDTNHLSNSLDTYAGGVEFDDVVDIRFTKVDSTHVYNLQTVDHCYSANGIMTHNCRSRLVYEVDGRYGYDDSASTRPSNFTGADGDRDPKRVSSKKKYYDSVKAMSEKDRVSILGPQLGKALGKMDADTFAKSLINSTYEPLSIKEMKAKSNKLGEILKAQSKNEK